MKYNVAYFLTSLVMFPVGYALRRAGCLPVLLLLCCCQAFAAHPATVRITVSTQTLDGKVLRLGSGTILDGERGLILTCAHCVRGYTEDNLTVEMFDKRGNVLVTAYGVPIAVDKKNDVAMVRIRPDLTKIKTFVVKDGYRYIVGEKVWTIGCAGGIVPVFRQTSIASQTYIGSFETRRLQRQGTSGGAVYNRKGRLIGVISGADDEAQTGVHTQITHVHKLVEEVCLKLHWTQYVCGPFG